MEYVSIGKRIRDLRIKNNLTQGQLAKKTGLSAAHISNIETAHTKVSLPSVVDIANILNVSVDELVGDSIRPLTNAHARSIYMLLEDCSNDELKFMCDVLETMKKSLREKNI